MNQTKKRLTIINLAISITDIETIQLQVLKLALLKSDMKVGKIISTLNEQNYAQAQRLISEYIDAPNETVLQRTTQNDIPNDTPSLEEKQTSQKEEEQSIIDEFDLFTTPAYETSEKIQEEVNYDAFLTTTAEAEKTTDKEVDYEPLLSVEANDVLPNNINLDISQDIEEYLKDKNTEVSSRNTEEETLENEGTHTEDTLRGNDDKKVSNEEEDRYSSYQAIPHINNKFNNLYSQYAPIEYTENRYYSVENWLLQISTNGYTEEEVETRIKDAEALKHSNLGESAQLLIAAGSTESLYALFRLARALFVGDILQKNIPEAVTLIHYLAVNEEYPEAICDLAQLYEQGIEVDKDKKKSESLYKEAMQLGIHRATKHYERIRKENKSLLAMFQK